MNFENKKIYHSWIGHIIWHNEFVVNTLEGAIHYQEKRTPNTILNASRQKQRKQYWKEWLATIQVGKLLINQKTEGGGGGEEEKEEEEEFGVVWMEEQPSIRFRQRAPYTLVTIDMEVT